MCWIIGNWKLHGLQSDLDQLQQIHRFMVDHANPNVHSGLCLPATLISSAQKMVPASSLLLGGQDCSAHDQGAYTGEVSGKMLKDAGAQLVILGHSERREAHQEENSLIAAKIEHALEAGLSPILCVGETLEIRKQGRHIEFVTQQLKNSLPMDNPLLDPKKILIAYEPIWAIGTGKSASAEDIAEMHAALFEELRKLFPDQGRRSLPPILYGGSMKGENAAQILDIEYVAGGLIGGASLRAEAFIPILQAALEKE